MLRVPRSERKYSTTTDCELVLLVPEQFVPTLFFGVTVGANFGGLTYMLTYPWIFSCFSLFFEINTIKYIIAFLNPQIQKSILRPGSLQGDSICPTLPPRNKRHTTTRKERRNRSGNARVADCRAQLGGSGRGPRLVPKEHNNRKAVTTRITARTICSPLGH